jgi:3-hydroxybutyryl-CoA dehydratase
LVLSAKCIFGKILQEEKMKLNLGDTASLTKTISSQDIVLFAEASGDRNPIHLDDNYAATTQFGKRIAHGLLVAGLISAVLGTRLPGTGCVYLSQTLQFKSPVYIGDTITATVEVVNIRDDKPIVTLHTVCTNQHGKTVIEGEAVLLLPMVTAA